MSLLILFQAGPLERVALPAGKRYAFITFQHSESVLYSKELLEGVQLFGQHLNMKPRNQSSNSNHIGQQSPALMNTPGIGHLMSPSVILPTHNYHQGQQLYISRYGQYPDSQYNVMPPDAERLNRLQDDVKRQLAHLSAMGQQQQQYQHGGYRRHGTSQWQHQGHRGYH